MAASVVDLADPVGPVTSTSPRGSMHRSRKIFGAERSSRLRMTEGILRNTAPAPRFWLKALTRKRASFGISKEKSVSKNSSKALRCLSFMMSYTMECTSLCDSGGMLMRFMSPSTRIIGGTPAERCRSEALFLTANASSCAISTAMNAPWNGLKVAGRSDVQSCTSSAGSITEGSHVQYVNASAEFAVACARGARSGGAGRAQRRPKCAVGHTPRRWQGAAPRIGGRRRRLRGHGLRRELPQGGAGRDCVCAKSGTQLAFHRPYTVQQDAPDRRTLRLGARARPPQRGRAALGAASLPRAPAQRVPAGESGRGAEQGGRRRR